MKKNPNIALDVDFIDDQEQPITAVELKLISDYFQKKKATKLLKNKSKVAVTAKEYRYTAHRFVAVFFCKKEKKVYICACIVKTPFLTNFEL